MIKQRFQYGSLPAKPITLAPMLSPECNLAILTLRGQGVVKRPPRVLAPALRPRERILLTPKVSSESERVDGSLSRPLPNGLSVAADLVCGWFSSLAIVHAQTRTKSTSHPEVSL